LRHRLVALGAFLVIPTLTSLRKYHDANKSPESRLLIDSNRTLQRTPEWKEPEPIRPKPVPVPTEPLSRMIIHVPEGAQQTTGSIPKPQVKVKVKTRGDTQLAETTNADDEPESAAEDSHPVYHVNRNIYKVFRTLFFVPSQTEQPGEVAWTDFLKAMKETGFIFQKLYGSVWQFTPQGLNVERGINFHEPHPSGKITFRTCRRYGRRLNRAYGWTGDMFILQN
jgi:hypothetical protein